MNTTALIEDIERQGLSLALNDLGGLRVRGPSLMLSDDLLIRLRAHKQDLINALRDRDETRAERAAILAIRSELFP